MRIAVGIATIGRPSILRETVKELTKQTRLPDLLVLCPGTVDDIYHQDLAQLPFATRIVSGPVGSSPQRNAILRNVEQFDAITFFDDDFFPSQNYLAIAEALLLRDPQIVLATGALIEDGIHGPGLSPTYARAKLATPLLPKAEEKLRSYYGVYGCNMVVRLAPVREHRVAFDEALPLYAWQEDIDFSRQLAPFGKIVCAEALTGVHLGVKRGRTSGVKFGYSQIANPVYLIHKGTMSLRFAGRTIARNLFANVLRSVRPEPYVDRRGRFKGNILAFTDLIRGRLHPGRILEIE